MALHRAQGRARAARRLSACVRPQILVIAVLMKGVLKRTFSVFQWEALVLLVAGITVNQLNYCTKDAAGPAVIRSSTTSAATHPGFLSGDAAQANLHIVTDMCSRQLPTACKS